MVLQQSPHPGDNIEEDGPIDPLRRAAIADDAIIALCSCGTSLASAPHERISQMTFSTDANSTRNNAVANDIRSTCT